MGKYILNHVTACCLELRMSYLKWDFGITIAWFAINEFLKWQNSWRSRGGQVLKFNLNLFLLDGYNEKELKKARSLAKKDGKWGWSPCTLTIKLGQGAGIKLTNTISRPIMLCSTKTGSKVLGVPWAVQPFLRPKGIFISK